MIMFNKRTKIREIISKQESQTGITVMGWVRSFRNNQFIALNDGSTNTNIQVVATLGKFPDELIKRITTSASLRVYGDLVPSLGKGQALELVATEIEILGDSDTPFNPRSIA